jgi:hypothetical protein
LIKKETMPGFKNFNGHKILICTYELARENIRFTKKYLTIMEVIIEFGGLSKGLVLIAGILISPIYYKI